MWLGVVVDWVVWVFQWAGWLGYCSGLGGLYVLVDWMVMVVVVN